MYTKKITVKFIILLILLFMLSGCPNDMMRNLVETKVSDPVADSFLINSGGTTNSQSVLLNSNVTKDDDALEMRYKNGSESWSDWESYSASKNWALTYGDGVKSVYAEYRDQGNHIVSMNNTIILDTNAPSGTGFFVWGSGIDMLPLGDQHDWTKTASVTIVINVAGADRMRFSNSPVTNSIAAWDAVTPTVTYTSSISWTLSPVDGTKTIYAQFLDAGNNDSYYQYSITLDTTPPEASSFYINSNDSTALNTSTNLSYNYFEANSAWAEYRNDGGNWSSLESLSASPVNKSWALKALTGDRTVNLRLTDESGNISPVYSDSIYLSTAAPDYPAVTASTPTNDSTPSWNWSSVTGATQYRVQLDTEMGSWINTGSTLNWSPVSGLTDGNHILFVQAGDIAGNWSDSGSFTLTIDTAPPSSPVSLDLAAADDSGLLNTDNITNKTSGLTISGNAEANSTVMIYENTTLLQTVSANGSGFFSGDISLSDGTKNIRARAEDEAGNLSTYSSSLTLTIDTVIPSAPSRPDLSSVDDSGILSTDNITNQTTGLSFSGTAESSTILTLYDSSADKGSMTVAGGNYSFSISLPEGTRSIRARTVDIAGNISSYSSTLSVTIDTSAPSYTGISVSGHTIDKTPTFSWSGAAGAVRYRHSWNNTAPWTVISSTSYTPSGNLSLGSHTLYVQHGDAAGNWSSGSGSGTTSIYNYLQSFSTGSSSKWFGGDDRVGFEGRNVGGGQVITITNTMTIKTFAFNFAGFSPTVTLVLNVRNSSTGAILNTYNINASSSGWVYWTGMNNSVLSSSSLIFTAYLKDGGTNQITSGINGDGAGGLGGNGYSSAVGPPAASNADMENWSNWGTHPWDFWFRVYGD